MTFKILILLPLLYDPFIGKDKTKHFGASFVMTQFFYQRTKSTEYTMALSLSIGIIKEFYDLKIKKTKFSLKDLSYDFAGTVAGIAVNKYY